MIFAIQGYSQVDIQIGSGTTNYYDPLPGWFGWNRSAYLYKASEINAGGVINSISFQIQAAGGSTNKLKIYLVETPITSMPGLSATNWNALKTGATLVYTNNAFSSSPTGWKTLTLDLPFAYSGVDNLMVLVEGEGCGTSGGCSSQCYNHDSPATHWYMRKDSSAPDDNAGSTSSTGQEGKRANIKFNISPLGDYCYPPTQLIADNITTTSADLTWTTHTSGSSWVVQYKLASDTTWGAENYVYSGSYSLQNLSSNTLYNIRVKSVCTTNESAWNTITFRTACDIISNLPYLESFDTYGTGSGVFLSCWGRTTSTPTAAPYISTTNSSAPGSMYMYTASGAYNYISTPEFDASIPINSLSANFYLRKSTLAYNITVGVMSDPSDTTTFDSLINLTPTAINSWQVFNVDFIDYTGTGQYIAFKVQGYGAANGMYLDDLIIYATPSCAIPTGIIRQNTTSNSFDLDWNNADDANCIGWIIDYKEHDATVWQEEFVTSHPHTLANLSPNTLYNIRLRAICSSGDTTQYTSVITYGMPCESISVFPWEEGFEDSWWVGDGLGGTADSRPWCWININGGASTSYKWQKTTTSSYVHSGTGAAQMYAANTTGLLGDWLITPAFSLTGNQRLRFWAKGYSTYTDNLTVKILDLTTNPTVSSAADTSLFVELMSNTVIPASDWTEYEINLSDFTGDFRFAFVRNTTGGYYLNIDDVSISDIPACARPTAINTGYVIDEEIELSWIPGNTGDAAWYLYWKTASATDYDSVYVTQQPYVLQNLTANTTYNIYLRTDCLTELSEATNPISIKTTLCAPVTTFPYTEGFDSLGAAGAFPTCWARPVIYSTYPKTSTAAARVHSAPASLEIHSAVGSPTYAVTPPIGEDINTLRVTFWAMAENITSSGTIEVGVMSDPNNLLTFESVQVIQPTNTSYNQYEVIFAGTTLNGLNKSIAFRQNTVSAIYYYWIDDVVVDYIPACSYPASVVASNITTTGADITWAPANATDNAWWLYYKTAAATSYDSIYITGTPTYSFTTLTANTLYNIYVSTDCGTELSEPTGVSNFRTACAAISTLPFFENFDTYGTGTSTYPLPNCWSRINTYTSSTMPFINTSTQSAPGCLYFYTPTSGTYNIGIMPPFDASIPINTLMASFYYKNNSATDRLIIGAMSDPTDATTFDSITTITASTTATWQFFEVNLSSYTGTGQYLAFKNAYTTANSYAYIDDLTISTIPTCPNTYSLAVASVTSSDVTLNWSAINSAGQGWEISYGAVGTGFDPSTGTIIPVADAVGIPPYTISGLTPSTPYSFAVRQACGGNWSNIVTVNTMGLPVQLPYTCDFEDVDERNSWSISNGGATNKWFIGTAVSATPITGNSLYISNDNGVSNAYTLTTISTVVASRLIEFDGSGGYTLTFDSRLGGESSHDYIKVYIVDQDTTYVGSASTPYYGSSTYSTGVVLFNGANAYFNNVSNPTTVNSHSVVVPYQGEAGTVRKLMFVWRNDGSGGTTPPAAIDNISITPITCAAPTLTISNISQTSADANWTSTASDNGWWLYYKTASATNYDSVYVTGTSSYSFTTFAANTAYNAYVRLDCGTELSAPSTVVNFRTACDNISTLPYSENFEGYGTGTSIMPACWVRTTTYADRPYVNTGGYSGNCLYFYAGTAGTYNIAAMNPIDASIPINSLMATFYYKNYASTNRLVVGVMTDPTNATTFDSITTIAAPSTATWAEYEVNFSSYTGTGTYIAFKNIYTTTDGYAYLDNLVIDIIPSCAPPTALTATGIGASMDVSFAPGNTTDNAWYVYYKPTTATDWDSVYTATIPTNIPGLTLQTTYQIYVKTVCSDGSNSNASQTITYITPCSAGAISSFPWTEGFEGGLSCWQQEFVVGTQNWTTSSAYPTQTPVYSGTGIAYISGTQTGNFTTKLISPLFDLTTLTNPYISFWHMQNWYSSYVDEMKVYYRTDASSAWVQLVHYPASITSYQKDSIALPNPSATYQIAFEGHVTWGYGVAIDDVTVYDASGSACPTPTNLATTTVQNTTATVSWIPAGTESAWQVRLGTTGTPDNVSSTTYTFPATLTPGTAYTYYVRANCGTNYSAWVQGTFTTTQGHQAIQVTTTAPTAITQTNATFQGTYIQGTEVPTAIGFEYKTTAATTWTDQAVTPVGTPFTHQLTTLTANTNYEVRAYAVTPTDGRVYGATLSFATPAIILPTVTTLTPNPIGLTNATFLGTITQGSEAINARGFEYKLPSQTWDNANVISATGTNNITASVTTLQQATTYEVRAYARTSTTTYGAVLTFTTQTPGVTPPVVVTNLANPVNDRSATLNGKVTPGSETITNQGFEWKATSSTTWTPVTVVPVNDTITYQLTGIEPSTLYEFKTFATTASGTEYGTTQTFQTLGLNTIDGSVITVMMYPNPASQETKLVVTGLQGEVKITISDVQGRIINTINTKANNNKVEETINVSNMANGVYYVRLQNDQISRTQKLIVK